jgi:hypothetical protein
VIRSCGGLEGLPQGHHVPTQGGHQVLAVMINDHGQIVEVPGMTGPVTGKRTWATTTPWSGQLTLGGAGSNQSPPPADPNSANAVGSRLGRNPGNAGRKGHSATWPPLFRGRTRRCTPGPRRTQPSRPPCARHRAAVAIASRSARRSSYRSWTFDQPRTLGRARRATADWPISRSRTCHMCRWVQRWVEWISERAVAWRSPNGRLLGSDLE